MSSEISAGSYIGEGVRICFAKKCGKAIDDNASFCAFCGAKISAIESRAETFGILCPKCNSGSVTTQAVPNKTKRRIIKTIVLFVLFVIPLIIMGYINRDYSFIEGATVGALTISLPAVIVGLIIFKIVYKFIPEPYDTMFMCSNCGNNWRSKKQKRD